MIIYYVLVCDGGLISGAIMDNTALDLYGDELDLSECLWMVPSTSDVEPE